MSQDARSPVTPLGNRWNGFWFAFEPAYTLGLVRMVFGVVVVGWAVNLLPDLKAFFGEDSVAPAPSGGVEWFGIFQVWTSDTAILIGWAILLLAAIAMSVGWHSRLAALTVWILLLSFIRRDPNIFNAGEGVMCITALVLTLSSCGAGLSMDQRRRDGQFWSAQGRSVWPVRLLQVQLSLIYFITAQAKLIGSTWVDGTAVSYAWRKYHDWAFLPAPQWVSTSPLLVNVATWGTLLIELAIAILVWNKRWRAKVLFVGVILHVAIYLSLSVEFFSLAMCVLYLAFVPWQTVQRLPKVVRGLVSRVRGGGADTTQLPEHL